MTSETRIKIVAALVDYTGSDVFRSIADDRPLAECGLDSLSLFNFLLNLEETLDCKIPDEDFSLARLTTIGAIEATLQRQLEGQ